MGHTTLRQLFNIGPALSAFRGNVKNVNERTTKKEQQRTKIGKAQLIHSRLNFCKYNQKRVHTETYLAYFF